MPISEHFCVFSHIPLCIKVCIGLCLCAIALIQNDTPTSKTKPLLDKRNPLICTDILDYSLLNMIIFNNKIGNTIIFASINLISCIFK